MTEPRPRPLLLGLGWPPDQTGGLNRYYRDLFEALGDATGVVIGPARDAPASVTAVSRHDAPMPSRVRAFDRAAQQAAGGADVVDAHFALYAARPVRRGAVADKPLVVHFQGPWASEHVAGRDHLGVRDRAARAVRHRIERSVYRRATRAVTLSGAFARILVEDYGVSPWRVRIVPPGVALDRFTPGDRDAARRRLGLPPGVPVVLSVRRLVPRTGVDVLLDAWAHVAPPAHRDRGRRPERPRWSARPARGLDTVRFAGAPDDDALVDWYRAADLTVVPSRALEGFGLVVLESLACGTAPVVTDNGGLPEAVLGLDPGLVVAAGDAAALAARIDGALTGTDPAPDAARCRAAAEQSDWATVADRNVAVYVEAVADRAAPARRTRVVYLDHVARSPGRASRWRLLDGVARSVDAHVVTFETGPLLSALGAAGITSEVVAMPARTTDLSRARVGRRLPVAAVWDTGMQVLRLSQRLRRLRPDLVPRTR
ncbi:MAG: glycosyltransferase family 4 protein [Acidimicrobiia bacterium]